LKYGDSNNKHGDSDFYNTQDGFGGIRKSAEPLQENNHSQQVIEMMNTRNPIKKSKLREAINS
jgi:hypothetical protein